MTNGGGLLLGPLAILIGGAVRKLTLDDENLRPVKLLVNSLDIPAAIVGLDEKVKYCNSHLTDFLKRDIAYLRQTPFTDFTLKEFIDKDVFLFHQVIDTSNDLEYYQLTKGWRAGDESAVYADMTVIPIMSGGEVIFTFVKLEPQKKKSEHLDQTVIVKESDNFFIQLWAAMSKNPDKVLKITAAFCLVVLTITLSWNAPKLLETIIEILKP